MEFIDLKSQYLDLKESIDARIHDVLNHGQYIMGPEVKELEEKLASYVGVKHAVSCANGTDALSLALMAMGVAKGDAVFVPTFTFFASAEAVALSGATPVFVDAHPDTFNMCPDDLEHRIKSVLDEGELCPKVVMTVDLFGLPADYEKIQAVASKYKLLTLEDAAQGLGGNISGKRAGSFGDIATTSFFPAKPLGCYGDGGAIFTDDDGYAELIRSYRIHGKGEDKYDNVRVGVNSRLDTIQAAILLEKLNVFDDELSRRNDVSRIYSEHLAEKAIKSPFVPDGYYSSWAQYTIMADNRDELQRSLAKKGIPTAIYYKKCMHEQSAFSNLKVYGTQLSVAEELSRKALSLPMHPYLSECRAAEIVNELG